MLNKLLTTLLFVACICLLSGCGGGTSGSGDIGGGTISGKVLNEHSTPLGGVRIIHLETGAEVVTNTNGEFTLSTDIKSANPELLVTFGSIERDITLNNIPAGTASVSTVLSINEVKGIVSVVSVQITPTESEVPTPTPTPSSSSPEDENNSPDKPAKYTWRIFGSLTTRGGIDNSGVSIAISPGSVTTRSDSSGNFQTRVTAQGSTLKFSINADGKKGSATLRNIPQGKNLDIHVEITLSPDLNEIDPNDPNPTPSDKIGVSVSDVQYD